MNSRQRDTVAKSMAAGLQVRFTLQGGRNAFPLAIQATSFRPFRMFFSFLSEIANQPALRVTYPRNRQHFGGFTLPPYTWLQYSHCL